MGGWERKKVKNEVWTGVSARTRTIQPGMVTDKNEQIKNLNFNGLASP